MQGGYCIVPAEEIVAYLAEPGRQEWAIAVECICVDGSHILPLVIFRGENMQSTWIPDNFDKDWSFTSNTKGWIYNDIGEQWIQ